MMTKTMPKNELSVVEDAWLELVAAVGANDARKR